MPILDMPLAELKEYRGISPRPDDFDAYWDRALTEMRAVDPEVEIVTAQFSAPFADCYDLYFTGVGGARIHAQYLKPKDAPSPHPAVLEFHGYSMDAGDWSNRLAYAAMGYTVAAMDCRGQGGLSEDTGGVKGNTLQGHIIRGLDDSPEKLLYRSIFLDTAQLASIIMSMPDVDENRVGVFGFSQGGGLTLACAALVPQIKRAAPVYPFLSDYQRVWEMDMAERAYEELRLYFRRFDPMHLKEKETFTTLGYIDVQHLAPRIRAEVMMSTGLMDDVCPPSTQFAAYHRITSPKTMNIYPDFGHEGIRGVNDQIFTFMQGL